MAVSRVPPTTIFLTKQYSLPYPLSLSFPKSYFSVGFTFFATAVEKVTIFVEERAMGNSRQGIPLASPPRSRLSLSYCHHSTGGKGRKGREGEDTRGKAGFCNRSRSGLIRSSFDQNINRKNSNVKKRLPAGMGSARKQKQVESK